MADTLRTRVGRILSSSAHAVIDAIEGAMPEAVMQQTMREIDDAIDEVRAELGRTIASRHLAGKRLNEQSSRHDELSEQIEQAVRDGREDLAKAAVEHQLDIEAQVPVLEATVADTSQQERELEGYVAALQAKRREMEEGFQALAEARARAQTKVNGAPAGGGRQNGKTVSRRVDDATGAFNRLMARQGAPGVAGVDAGKDAKLAELDKWTRQNRVEERLAMVRAQVGKD